MNFSTFLAIRTGKTEPLTPAAEIPSRTASLPRASDDVVRNLIIDTFVENQSWVVDWSQIVAHVKTGVTVKNWLTEVRGPLQGLIDQGFLFRLPDIQKEKYQMTRA